MFIVSVVFAVILLFCTINYVKQSSYDGHLITDFSQQTCVDKANNGITYYYWIDKDNHLPYCKDFRKEGYKGKGCPCPPGYECKEQCNNTKISQEIMNIGSSEPEEFCSYVCLPSTKPLCMAYHANTPEYQATFYSALKFKPKCTNNGEWEPKQCKGGISGKCFCFDAKGKRLFGQAKHTESKKMTCACSRRRAELIAAGRNYPTFHCDRKGNFEELQCDSGLCWCVEPERGKLVSPVVPEKVMTYLPCYKAIEVGSQYLRKCDSMAHAIANIEKALRNHGVVYVNMGNIQCDGDGAYGNYNLSGSIARCTWRDGNQIGPWQSDVTTDISKLNCNCARDFKIYQHQLMCDGAGNYFPLQTIILNAETKYFCVDTDGYPKTEFFDTIVENCTKYF